MDRRSFLSATAAAATLLQGRAYAAEADSFPPGWLPLSRLDDETAWAKTDDRIRLYLPPGDKAVKGIFACFVFHSGDPRELARLWNFALVTVPWPFEYDLGINDKRNGRYQVGHKMQDMSLLLRYLEVCAKETGHAELSRVPLVGWLGQNGSHFGADLYEQVPERVLAWSDSFPDRLAKYPQLTERVPFALAWELGGKERDERTTARDAAKPSGRASPPPDLKCRANTYGFPHGIYSKFNFFMAFLDRCIQARMPDGDAVKGLKPLTSTDGWAGDYNALGQWSPIAPAAEASDMIAPIWLPDEYAAWMWRSYHSHQPDIKLTSPVVEYRKKDGKWGGPECGLGYNGYLSAEQPLGFSASTSAEYVKVEFHDGPKIIGTANTLPYKVDGIKLEPGLRALFAVGVAKDGSRTASRPAFAIVK